MSQLSSEQRRQVLNEIGRSLIVEWPRYMNVHEIDRPGGAADLIEKLDYLVDLVRRTQSTLIEAYLFQILEDVCPSCAYQFRNGYCPLRSRQHCVLYQCTGSIVNAIGKTLREMGDAQYLATHPRPVTVNGKVGAV